MIANRSRMWRPVSFLVVAGVVLAGTVGCDHDGPNSTELPVVSLPSVSVSGMGTVDVGRMELAKSVGFCEIAGSEIPAIIYARVPWPEYDLTIYNMVAPTSDNLHVLFLYARADTMRSIWHESYSDQLGIEIARGDVSFSNAFAESRPSLGRVLAVPDSSQLVSGVELNGPGIQYANQAGTIEVAGTVHRLYPFELVNCSNCGSDAGSGWLELHSIIGEPGRVLGFGIIYLYLDGDRMVELHYYILLDPVRHGPGVAYEAEWTVASSRVLESASSWVHSWAEQQADQREANVRHDTRRDWELWRSHPIPSESDK